MERQTVNIYGSDLFQGERSYNVFYNALHELFSILKWSEYVYGMHYFVRIVFQ